jgi:hypothetical protein
LIRPPWGLGGCGRLPARRLRDDTQGDGKGGPQGEQTSLTGVFVHGPQTWLHPCQTLRLLALSDQRLVFLGFFLGFLARRRVQPFDGRLGLLDQGVVLTDQVLGFVPGVSWGGSRKSPGATCASRWTRGGRLSGFSVARWLFWWLQVLRRAFPRHRV